MKHRSWAALALCALCYVSVGAQNVSGLSGLRVNEASRRRIEPLTPAAPQVPSPPANATVDNERLFVCSIETGLFDKVARSIFDGLLTETERFTVIDSDKDTIKNKVSCNLQELRASIIAYITRGNAGGGLSEAQLLHQQVVLGISSILWTNEQYIAALADAALSNNWDTNSLLQELTKFVVERAGSNVGLMNYVVSFALANGAPFESVKDTLVAVLATGDVIHVDRLFALAMGPNPSVELIKYLYTSLIVMDVTGRRGALPKLLNIGKANRGNILIFKRVLTNILIVQLESDPASTESVVNMVVGKSFSLDTTTVRFEADVTALIVTDITGNRGVLRVIVQLTKSSYRAEKTVESAISNIVKNIVKGQNAASTPEAIFNNGLTLVNRLRNIDVAAAIAGLGFDINTVRDADFGFGSPGVDTSNANSDRNVNLGLIESSQQNQDSTFDFAN